MILVLSLLFTFVTLTTSTDILVKRGKNYDTIVWDGDCYRIEANYVRFGNEKMCVCKKKLKVHDITTEMHGFFYQTADRSPTCLYDLRETGANFFLQPGYNGGIRVIDNSSRGKKFLLAERFLYTLFSESIKISIKEVWLYNFNRDKPFTKITNDIFQLTKTEVTPNDVYLDTPRYKKYQIQVNISATRKIKGNLVQIIFQKEHEVDKIKENVGFTVVKFVGDAIYDLDLRHLQMTEKDTTYKIVSVTFVLISVILAITIVMFIVWWRQGKITHEQEGVVTKGTEFVPYNDIMKRCHQIGNGYNHHPKMSSVADDKSITYITANESSHPSKVRKVEPIYETADPIELNELSWSNVTTIQNKYYNIGYMYEEIHE